MSDIQTLVEMGFDKQKAEHAIKIAGSGGLEQAMEWLLAHADEEIPNNEVPNNDVPNNEVPNNAEEPNTGEEIAATAPEAAEGSNTASNELVKSLQCNECQKLFKNQLEVEFHAAKTGHKNFSESTEEKKPLTEEEKRAQLVLIEEKLKQKRIEREKQERVDALEREKSRIKAGKDMNEAKRRLEELEMAKILEQRKKEKAEEKASRDRVKAQIEADKLARKMKIAIEQGLTSPTTVTSTVPSTSSTPSVPKKDYTQSKIQIRLQDGNCLTETFNTKEPLSAVRTFIQVSQGIETQFELMTSFPKKLFSDEDYEKPLEVLGLVPSAVIIMTKKK